jgi:hypothetical protein
MFGFFLGILFSLLGFTLLLSVSENIPFLQIAQATGSIAVGISAIVALNLYRTTLNRHESEDKRNRSKEYLSQAIVAIERSYDIFTDNEENTEPPRNDRALWLTAARFIIRFRRLKEKITEPDHIDVISEHEEYWRNKYATLLSKNKSKFDLVYFMPNGNNYGGEVVQRDSIGVVFDFARWPEDNDDPLHGVDVIEMYARGAIPIDFFGIEEYIEKYVSYHEKIEKRKNEINENS